MSETPAPVESFVPDDELDPTSKVSLMIHISHRLRLVAPIDCGLKNGEQTGRMSTKEVGDLAAAIVEHEWDINPRTKSGQKKFLQKSEKALPGMYPYLVERASGSRGVWDACTKLVFGRMIADVLGFEFREEHHIGAINGNVTIEFLAQIYDKLPSLEEERSGEPSNLGLPEAESYFTENAMKRNEGRSPAARQLTAVELNRRFQKTDHKGIAVPSYQRADSHWTKAAQKRMVDSMLKAIPMPSIVLGRTEDRKDGPWQLVDGHQRISTLRKFMDTYHPKHFTFMGYDYDRMPDWAKSLFDHYEFNVEFVQTKDDQGLAQLYSRYNSSGKTMTPVQLRVARWHEIGPLHHLLLAMAGGPVLFESDPNGENVKAGIRNRLGISEKIDAAASRAAPLRDLLPNVSRPEITEQEHLKRVTEKVYDHYCKTMAYCSHEQIVGPNGVQTPTAEHAVETLLTHYTKTQNRVAAHTAIDRLENVIRLVHDLYENMAFKGYRAVDDDPPWRLGNSVHGWSMHVQAGAIWDLSDAEIKSLKANKDDLQAAWEKFALERMAGQRMNTKSIWDVHRAWRGKVKAFVVDLNAMALRDPEDPAYQSLMDMVDIIRAKPNAEQEATVSSLELVLDPAEIEFIKIKLGLVD